MRFEKLVNGKVEIQEIASGCKHSPLPRTERGKRRRLKNHPNGIQKGTLGWNASDDNQTPDPQG